MPKDLVIQFKLPEYRLPEWMRDGLDAFAWWILEVIW